ncbi:50S ribosomal protein L23 [Mycoplasmoides pirum]|uniref:50S ribosomal protein L23 n=1 Tax=Mycoplasmoides pirum TaxID=2122 RepID=UPI0004898BE6|nr:50S ribosomal protein L23 [Mycoplasmoides pirum]
MDLTTVLIKPILTEKTYFESLGNKKKYSFQIDLRANKTLVKQAFTTIYGVTPLSVNIKIRKSVKTKTGTAKPGYTKTKKIAIITLPPGIEILVTGEKPEAEKNAKTNSKE